MTNETLLYFIVDAGRWDYINERDTPFIWQLAKRGIYAKQCLSSAGFTQRTAMFSGAYPDTTNSFTMYCYDPPKSPFAVLKKWMFLIAPFEIIFRSLFIPGEPKIISKIRLKFYKEFRWKFVDPIVHRYSPNAPTLLLPSNVLPYMAMSEENERLIYEKRAMGVESIFDKLIDPKTSFGYYAYPVLDGPTVKVLKGALKFIEDKKRFFTFQFSESDNAVHYLGAESAERIKIMREIDSAVKKIHDEALKLYERVVMFLVGDHGMIDVHKRVNAEKLIHYFASKKGFKHFRDYLLFLDSTMVRVWCFTKGTYEIFQEIFSMPPFQENGLIVDKKIASKYRFPFPNKMYGDIGWWASPGVLISPCYFHPKGDPVVAMHGYESYHPASKGFIIVNDSAEDHHKFIEEAQLVDVCPTLCDLLDVPYPKDNEGKSLFAF